MTRRTNGTDAAKVREVVDIFLDSAETLARAPDQVVAAVEFGLERVFDQLVREACREKGLKADAFGDALEADAALHERVQARLAALFTPEKVEAARSHTARKDAQRHLYVLRYVLAGEEPPEWVWNAMDRDEQVRLRGFREAGGDDDEALLLRVRHALGKIGQEAPGAFGRCEGCAVDIVTERLALMPYAERCTDCQNALEQPPRPEGPARIPVRMFFEGGKPVAPEDAQR